MELRFFEIYRSSEYLLLLFKGAGTSLILTVLAGILGFIFAVLLSFSNYFKIPILSQSSTCFVEFTRGVPQLVQIKTAHFTC